MVVASGSFGGGVGQLVAKRRAESAPRPDGDFGGPDGSVLIVDRSTAAWPVTKTAEGLSQIPIGGDTVRDLTIGAEGRVVLLDRFVDRGIFVYGPRRQADK